MFKNITVEAEQNELILKNKKGDYVIIPANKRNWVTAKLKEKCHTCIDSLVETLPIASQYAEFGSVYSEDGGIDDLLLTKKGAQKIVKGDTSSKNDAELLEMVKAKMKLGHRVDYKDAVRYIELNNLKGKDLHKFVSENVKQGFKIGNEKEWVKEVPNKDYVPPVTEQQILNYRKYNETVDKLKADPTFNELKTFLEQNQYVANGANLASKEMTGQNILDMAKSKGVPITKNEDGTFSLMDDENTFADTDKSFAKARIIHPLAKYSNVPYVKGNDIVNYYNMVAPPTYSDRVPTPQEEKDYTEGRYFTEGMTPEFNKVYIDAYLDPKNAQTEGSLTNRANNDEMTERYKKVKEIADNIKMYKESEEYKKDKEWQASKSNPKNWTKELITGRQLIDGLKYGNNIKH
jgi:hypothetical protein